MPPCFAPRSSPGGDSGGGRGTQPCGSERQPKGRERVAHPCLEPGGGGPFAQVVAGDDRVRVLRRTRLFNWLLPKCGGIIQLPEGEPGLPAKVDPIGHKEPKAEGWGNVELVAEFVTA